MCRITFLIFEGLSGNKACSFSKKSEFQRIQKKSLRFSKGLKIADQGRISYFSRLLKSKCGKGNRQKSSVEYFVTRFQVEKEELRPLRLLGLFWTSLRWEVSWQMSHAGTRHKIRKWRMCRHAMGGQAYDRRLFWAAMPVAKNKTDKTRRKRNGS